MGWVNTKGQFPSCLAQDVYGNRIIFFQHRAIILIAMRLWGQSPDSKSQNFSETGEAEDLGQLM